MFESLNKFLPGAMQDPKPGQMRGGIRLSSASRQVPTLVFICCILSFYAMFDRYVRDTYVLLGLACAILFYAFTRLGKRVVLSRTATLLLVVGLIGFLVFGVFILRVPPEQALVFFITALMLAKSFILCRINDYGQLMFLSVLSILAAGSYNPTSNFGVVVFLYTIIAGYTLFRFHLLSESLAHRRMQAVIPALVVNEIRRGWFKPYLAMAVLTCVVAYSFFSIIPRQGPAFSLSEEFGSRTSAMTGFTPEMILGQMSDTLEDLTSVLRVRYLRDKNRQNYTRELYLRGVVLKRYCRIGKAWKWADDEVGTIDEINFDDTQSRAGVIQPSKLHADQQNLWRISFEQAASTNLFVIDRPVAVSSNQSRSLLYNPHANTLLVAGRSPEKGFTYELLTEPAPIEPGLAKRPATAPTPVVYRSEDFIDPPVPSTKAAALNPEIRQEVDLKSFAQIAGEILGPAGATLAPEIKAQKIETWLRSNFSYTLNNTDVDRSVEPVMDFLTRRKHGHCEYFASAMTLLARSAGLDAQVVAGFKGGVYNSFGDFYLIRNCDAHAWVEVLVPHRGWLRFDPTPSARDEIIRQRDSGTFKWFWDLVDLVQYNWFERISDLGKNERQEFMRGLQQRAVDSESFVQRYDWSPERIYHTLVKLIRGQDYESVWLQVLHSLVFVLIMVMTVLLLRIAWVVGGIAYGSINQSFHRRWERRFGRLWFCPVDFYRRVLLWLATRGVTRQNTETARDFAERIGVQYPAISQNLRYITDAYLAVRFGNRSLSLFQRNKVNMASQQIHAEMEGMDKAKK